MFLSGDSAVVSLPAKELESAGIETDEIVGEEVYAKLEDGEFTVDLESVAGEAD